MNDPGLRRELRYLLREAEHRQLLEEAALDNITAWFKERGAKGKKLMKKFLVGLKQELEETKEGIEILRKIADGEDVTTAETEFVKDQAKDLAKGTVLLAVFFLPGGKLWTPGLMKIAAKFGVDMKPSAFRGEEVTEGLRRIVRRVLGEG